ncbi:contact-dependent growth inhibition system immunity protein, partial [Acetobacter lovaniensis]|uniref:contact-dependent growth inhibition system immunity protein n=1 Tax=Acetobacter lovaniensis TaxID=104100 RepID=UPI00376F9083
MTWTILSDACRTLTSGNLGQARKPPRDKNFFNYRSMILEDRSEALHHFFGAYFHQDWGIEHDSAEEI